MYKLSRRQFLLTCTAGTLALGAIESVYSQKIQVTRNQLHLSGWEANGFKVAFLSDFHICGPKQFAVGEKAFRLALKEKPDIIAIGGDLVDSSIEGDLSYLKKSLKMLSETDTPVFAVTGNHEYAIHAPPKAFELFRKSRVRLLQNEQIDFQGVSLIGIDDPLSGNDCYEFLQKSKLSPSSLSLMHEPDFVERLPKPVKLQISGHSHGGQVCFPFGLPILKRPGALKYTAGYYPLASCPLYVSRGVGTTGIDFRFFCPREVTTLTLYGS